jgi:hypothetical protein
MIVGEVQADDLRVIVPRSEHTLRNAMSPADQAKVPHPRPQLSSVTCDKPYDNPGNVNITQTQEIAAVYIQAASPMDSDEGACNQCIAAFNVPAHQEHRPYFFADCKSYETLQGGACANCVMKHRAAYCSFRELKSEVL